MPASRTTADFALASGPHYQEAVRFAETIGIATGHRNDEALAYEWKRRRMTCAADAITCFRRAVKYLDRNESLYAEAYA